jgi:hypothetical protein
MPSEPPTVVTPFVFNEAPTEFSTAQTNAFHFITSTHTFSLRSNPFLRFWIPSFRVKSTREAFVTLASS